MYNGCFYLPHDKPSYEFCSSLRSNEHMTLEQCLILRNASYYTAVVKDTYREVVYVRHEGPRRNLGVVPLVLNHGNRWGEYSASQPCRFTPGERGFTTYRRVGVCTGCWWGNLRERGHWGNPDVDRRMILRWIFRKLEGVVRTWSWLGIGTGGRHL
jgi:hypothetical protein